MMEDFPIYYDEKTIKNIQKSKVIDIVGGFCLGVLVSLIVYIISTL
jgi:acid phosphatase family membrane protein YuiD